jgi:hypothetical protein
MATGEGRNPSTETGQLQALAATVLRINASARGVADVLILDASTPRSGGSTSMRIIESSRALLVATGLLSTLLPGGLVANCTQPECRSDNDCCTHGGPAYSCFNGDCDYDVEYATTLLAEREEAGYPDPYTAIAGDVEMGLQHEIPHESAVPSAAARRTRPCSCTISSDATTTSRRTRGG